MDCLKGTAHGLCLVPGGLAFQRHNIMEETTNGFRHGPGASALAALSLQIGAFPRPTPPASNAVRPEVPGCCEPVCHGRNQQPSAWSRSDTSFSRRGPSSPGNLFVGRLPRLRQAARSIGAGAGFLVSCSSMLLVTATVHIFMYDL